jgi:hypothetical protein
MSGIRIIRIDTWSDYRTYVSSKEFQSWAFRGQSDSEWPVFSSLSRYLRNFNVHRDAWAFQEERVLRIFRRKARLYLNLVPEEDDAFQWLALMQHHGTPTRLIDFTWSPYVAVFFALHRATKDSAVWAIFPPRIDHSEAQEIRGGQVINAPDMWLRTRGNYEKYFLPGDKPFVVTGDPEVMNQRLTAQSGTFAVPGILDEPLEKILGDYPCSKDVIIKFELNTSKVRKEAMQDLYVTNIREATLFPDMDGMARSLAYELEFHWAYDPTTMETIDGFENPPFGLPNM